VLAKGIIPFKATVYGSSRLVVGLLEEAVTLGNDRSGVAGDSALQPQIMLVFCRSHTLTHAHGVAQRGHLNQHGGELGEEVRVQAVEEGH